MTRSEYKSAIVTAIAEVQNKAGNVILDLATDDSTALVLHLKALLDAVSSIPVVVDAGGKPVGALEAKPPEKIITLGSVSSWAG